MYPLLFPLRLDIRILKIFDFFKKIYRKFGSTGCPDKPEKGRIKTFYMVTSIVLGNRLEALHFKM